MAFNGSGTFSRSNGVATGSTTWATTAASDPKIRTSHHDTHDEDLATGLTNCICKDGQTTITANIPFNNKKITGLGLGTANTDAAAISNISAMALLLDGTNSPSANLNFNSKKIINLASGTNPYDSACIYDIAVNAIMRDGSSTATGNIPMGSCKLINLASGTNPYDSACIYDIMLNAIMRDGSSTATANIPMGSNKITGLASGTASGDAIHWGQFSWSDWTPSYSCSGSLTISSTSTTFARYFKIGKMVWFNIQFQGTLGGVEDSAVYASIPTGTNSYSSFSVGTVYLGAYTSWEAPTVNMTSNQIRFTRADATTWPATGLFSVAASGFYEID
jgi:hypothetical protein